VRGSSFGVTNDLRVAHLIGDELGAVGGDANERRPGLAFAVREVPRELILGCGALDAQVPLELEHGVPEERVDAPADLGQGAFEVDGGAVRSERLHEQRVHEGAYLLVSGTARKLGDDLAEALAGDGHGWPYDSRSPGPRPDVRIGASAAKATL
jgi:hypothetical protein